MSEQIEQQNSLKKLQDFPDGQPVFMLNYLKIILQSLLTFLSLTIF